MAMDDDAVENMTREHRLSGYRVDLAATLLHGEKWFGGKGPDVGLALSVSVWVYRAGHTA